MPAGAKRAPVTRPRPGHADLAGVAKYGRDDMRDVLERASARETAARVAAGAIARQLLAARRRTHRQPRVHDRLRRPCRPHTVVTFEQRRGAARTTRRCAASTPRSSGR